MFFRPSQTLEILSILLFRKTLFCMLKNFLARRELAEVLQQNINSEFLCIITLSEKSALYHLGYQKHLQISVANFVFVIQNPFLFCMLKNFA